MNEKHARASSVLAPQCSCTPARTNRFLSHVAEINVSVNILGNDEPIFEGSYARSEMDSASFLSFFAQRLMREVSATVLGSPRN